MASPVWRANLTFGAPVSGRDVATQIGHLTTIVVVIVEVVGPPVGGGVEISTLTTQERWLVAAIVRRSAHGHLYGGGPVCGSLLGEADWIASDSVPKR